MKILTKQEYDVLVEALRGITNARPVSIPAGDLRAVLRAIDRARLADSDDPDDAPPPQPQETA